MATLMTLSDELLDMILQHLHEPPRPRQPLYSARLVCRRFWNISQPSFFKHVEIDLSYVDDDQGPFPDVRRLNNAVNDAALQRLRWTMILLQQSSAFSLVRQLTLHLPQTQQCSTSVVLQIQELVKQLVNLKSIRVPQNLYALASTDLREIESVGPSFGWHIEWFNPRTDHRCLLEHLSNISSLKAVIVEKHQLRCGRATRLPHLMSTSALVRDILAHNPNLNCLSLQLLRFRSRGIPGSVDEKAHAVENLLPVLSQIRDLELEGFFQIPDGLWNSLKLDCLRCLSLYHINTISSFAQNLVGKVPLLKRLKLSAYPCASRRSYIEGPDVAILVNPVDYGTFKSVLMNFLSSTRIESLTLCHFPNDTLQEVCDLLGSTLRHFDVHYDIQPLYGLVNDIGLHRTNYYFGAIEVLTAIDPELRNLEHLGMDVTWMETLQLRPGGYRPPYEPPIHPPPSADLPQFLIPPPPPLPPAPISSPNSPPKIPVPAILALMCPPPPNSDLSPNPPSPVIHALSTFRRLKHITLVTQDTHHFHDITDEDVVRTFCYIQEHKAGVPLECLEIFSTTYYSVWENGERQCIMTRSMERDRKRVEQVWDTRPLKMVQEKARPWESPPEVWGVRLP